MTPARKVSTLVVGAGPCGLGAAERLVELGDDRWLLVEASTRVGGHARSVRDGAGFVWDIGGHVQYARSEAYSRLLERLFPEGMHELRRNSSAYHGGRFVPYPFQLNIAALAPPERDAALRDLVAAARTFPAARDAGRLARFGDYLLAKYGTSISEAFLVPYNRKAWSIDLNLMGTYWLRDFLAEVDVDEAVRNVAEGTLTTGWGYNATFRYPRSGGCGEVWRRLGAELQGTGRVALTTRVVGVDPARRLVRLDRGGTVGYEQLVSTMPLPVLCVLTGDPELIELSRWLHASQLLAIGVGLEGDLPEMLDGRSWIYVAAADCPFHRVSVLSNYSAGNVPVSGRQFSLLCEVSAPPRQVMDRRRLVEQSTTWLASHGFTAGARIVSTWSFHTRFGYPTPTLDRDDVLDEIQSRLVEWGIHSRGRNGTWVYESSNQDATYQQGRDVVDVLTTGLPETTVRAV